MVAALGDSTELVIDERRSGPLPDGRDPFTTRSVDLGVMCAPPYLTLRRSSRPAPVELLGCAPVFDDPRARGLPVYFADVVVRSEHPAQHLEDLRGAAFGFNDASSLSGLLALQWHLGGDVRSFFGTSESTGSHDASLSAVADGSIDVASIDSNTLRLRRAAGDPGALAVRVLAGLGPYPIQPVVVRSTLTAQVKAQVLSRLWMLDEPNLRGELASFGCTGFAPVSDDHYLPLVNLL